MNRVGLHLIIAYLSLSIDVQALCDIGVAHTLMHWCEAVLHSTRRARQPLQTYKVLFNSNGMDCARLMSVRRQCNLWVPIGSTRDSRQILASMSHTGSVPLGYLDSL